LIAKNSRNLLSPQLLDLVVGAANRSTSSHPPRTPSSRAISSVSLMANETHVTGTDLAGFLIATIRSRAAARSLAVAAGSFISGIIRPQTQLR
jgi:hypothetical protein